MKYLWTYLLLLLTLQTTARQAFCSGALLSSVPVGSKSRVDLGKRTATPAVCSASIPITIYALPFKLETLVPMTKTSFRITSHASPSVILRTEPEIRKFLDLLQSGKTSDSSASKNSKPISPLFDELKVRMIVELARGERVVYVDNVGTVQDKQATYKVPPKSYRALSKMIDGWWSEAFTETVKDPIAPHRN